MYASDHADGRRGGRFRWVLSTCLAAAVGALAILVAVTGSMDSQDQDVASLEERLQQASLVLQLPATRSDGLRWSMPRTGKLLIPTGAFAVKNFVAEPVKQRRGAREYTMNKYYVRLAARLGPISRKQAAAVPSLNPIKLYADIAPVEGGERPTGSRTPARPPGSSSSTAFCRTRTDRSWMPRRSRSWSPAPGPPRTTPRSPEPTCWRAAASGSSTFCRRRPQLC
jgi:hypothetical protein